MSGRDLKRVLITGGAGYVGAMLIRRLLAAGYQARVLDLYLFGDHVFDDVANHPRLQQIKGDIRDAETVREAVRSCDAVIHLACISNDPSFELNPALGRAINFDSFAPLVRMSRDAGVQRFIYASSSSVYGVSDAPEVTESHPVRPITDYSRYKALCEPILHEHLSRDFTTVVVRPATVCGWSPRQRLDLTVNILTNHAVNLRKISVFGGSQKRPNIHIQDMVDLYLQLLEFPSAKIAGKTYNAGYHNHTVADLAQRVRDRVTTLMPGAPINIVKTPTEDLRSYHISSKKIEAELGFVARRSIEDAVSDLVRAFESDKLPASMTDRRYYNIKTMQHLGLS